MQNNNRIRYQELSTKISLRFFTFYFLLFTFYFLLSSCGNGKNDQQNTATDATNTSSTKKDTGKIDGLTQFKYDKLIGNIPIPFDILRFHLEVPLTYNASVLNPTSNLPFYSSNSSKSLNLRVYGADLAYNITYEKFDDMGNYLKCAKKLADDFDIMIV